MRTHESDRDEFGCLSDALLSPVPPSAGALSAINRSAERDQEIRPRYYRYVRAMLGVLAFGRDTDIRKAFQPFKITSFDTRAISPINSPARQARAHCCVARLFRA
jgi:hypothetical protein